MTDRMVGGKTVPRNRDMTFLRDNAELYRPSSLEDLTDFLDKSETTGYGKV